MVKKKLKELQRLAIGAPTASDWATSAMRQW
jgi:hypothetical protein